MEKKAKQSSTVTPVVSQQAAMFGTRGPGSFFSRAFVQPQPIIGGSPGQLAVVPDNVRLQDYIRKNNTPGWGAAYNFLNRQNMARMLEIIASTDQIDIGNLISHQEDGKNAGLIGVAGLNRVLAAIYAVKSAADSKMSMAELDIARQKSSQINVGQRIEIRSYLSKHTRKSKAARKLFNILNKPFLGYVASGYDFEKRFMGHAAELGFELEPGEGNLKFSAFPDNESIKQGVDVTNAAAESFEQSDLLFFSGHQFAQYGKPGIFSDNIIQKTFDVGAISKKMNRVKLMVSTSCAIICKDPARVFSEKFPNALILGYRFSAPSNGEILSKAFIDHVMKKGILDLNTQSGIDSIKDSWRKTSLIFGRKEGSPGMLYNGEVEFWNGKNWQKEKADSKANECQFHMLIIE